MNTRFLFFWVCLFTSMGSVGQDADTLIAKVKARLDRVRDYSAEAYLKTDVSFMKVPTSDVTVYYKKPNLFRIVRKDGISLLPKGGFSINLNALFAKEQYLVVPAGEKKEDGKIQSIVKLLPRDENGEFILSTLYIDPQTYLISKAIITTRENGTFEVNMQYGKFASWALPDQVVFVFNSGTYKIPKGVTFEYDTGEKQGSEDLSGRDKKGKLEIRYSSYRINKGLSDTVFD